MSILCTCGTPAAQLCVLHNFQQPSVPRPYCAMHRMYDCMCSYPKSMCTSLPESHWVVQDLPAPEVGGTKYDQEKPHMDLLSREALIQTAQVLTFGAKKYTSHNWRKGIAWSRVLGAAMRHLTAFNDGEDKDPETGLSHLAHLGCCVMFLLEYEKTHKELDDRYKGESK